ncbi:reverse transcriptase domain-containing protein [Tanacetum coccineum]
MRTCSSSNLVGNSSPNPTSSKPKRRNRRRSKQLFNLEEPLENQAPPVVIGRSTYYGGIAPCTHRGLCGGNRDLVSKFINEFIPPSRTTNLRNEISNFQQRFDESFHEAWDRYKDLIRACPHHSFTELHQLDTFYNALNLADQDSLNSATGGNLLERSTQDVLTIIENKSKVRNSRNKSIVSQVKSSDVNSSSSSGIAKLTHAVNQQTSVVTTAVTAILKQFQVAPHPAFVKAVKEICVTCGGAHPYYQCFAADDNTFLEYRDNIQGYVAAAAGNYNPDPIQQNQSVPLSELENFKKINDVNMKAMQTQINNVKNELRNEMQNSIQTSMSNQTNELKNMMSSFFQMNIASTLGSGSLPSNTVANLKGELNDITTRSGLVLDGPTVPMPPSFINPEEDERVKETLTDLKHAVILKKLPEKLGDPGKFLIPCGFSELKCKALANLGIARDVFVPVGKFTFPADFLIVDYESDPRVPLILGRPFLRTARALIDVHGEEMILRDGNERLTLNMRHDTSSYSTQPHQESINMIDVYNVSHEEYCEDLFATNHQSGNPTSSLTFHTDLTSPEVNDDIFDPEGDIIENLLNLDKTKDLPPYHDNSLSGNPTPILEPVAKSSSSSPTLTDMERISHKKTKNQAKIDKRGHEMEKSLRWLRLSPKKLKRNQRLGFANPGILIHENHFEVTNLATPDKNVKKISYASLILKDFNPPLYELPFHKEVPELGALLSFSSKNEKKVFNHGILTSKGVHISLLPELSHRGTKAFKVIKIFESPMEIFPCSYGEDIRFLDVPCLHFYPP